ncbi:uncharacterized protein LOC141614775 isoform X2 [Silene latifolia]|uniref:uncharacterized protein LOC141614775 isoform X2 n=1 Tax=Silene latifolia TaxID=37657 RepID=UPI003D76B75B
MGQPPSNRPPSFRFYPAEVAQMDAILQKHEGYVPPRDFLVALAHRFSQSPERAGKIVVQMKQVSNWFQKRRYALKVKLVKSPVKHSASFVTPLRNLNLGLQQMSTSSEMLGVLEEAEGGPQNTALVRLGNLLELAFNKGLQVWNPMLKNIYVLIHSYLSYGINNCNYWSSTTKSGLELTLEDTSTRSIFLLEELHRILFSLLQEVSLGQDVGLTLSDDNHRDSPEEILLLLRCCCLIVWLHPHDQTVIKKIKDVVALLRRLSHLICSLSNKSTDSSIRFVKQMLEVYVDEVFADRPFQECLAISESVSYPRQSPSICSTLQIKSVLEVMTAHFLLSVPRDYALQTFLETLIWTEKNVQSHPELSITVGLSLIKHPEVLSVPVIFRSHIVSLVSEAIGICSFPHMAGVNVSRSKLYLSAFYDAAILYRSLFSKLMTSSQGKTVNGDFQSHFQRGIFDKVNLMLADMNHAWRAQISETTSIVTSDAISYIKMNIHIIGKTDQDNVVTFMSSVVSKIICAETDEGLLEMVRAMTLQDICLLASAIKLMSCSVLQATRCSDNRISKNMVLDNSPLSGIMSCFAQYNLLPVKIQQLLIDGLKPVPSSYDEYKLLFVHFAGLLSSCMVSGLGILVKGCLFLMLALLNTVIWKEGGSDFLRPLANDISQANSPSTPTENTPNNTSGRTKKKILCVRMASKFQSARRLMLRRQTSLDSANISDEEPCNGEAYLKCFTSNSKDIAELADFIVCEPGKDYTSWLHNREKYRSKRREKLAKRRKKRMIKVCRSLRHQSRVKL